MSVVSRFAKTAKAKLAEGSKVALKGAGDAFNKLDELGGEARDTIVEWWDQSPAMGTVREMLKKRSAQDVVEANDLKNDVVEAVLVSEEPLGDAKVAVQIFGKRSCPWSGRAVRLLEDRDIEHVMIDLDDSENSSYSSRLVSETKQNTVPYVYVRGEFIGGFNALDELDRLGQLEARTEAKTDDTSRTKVEVAPRPTTDEVAPAVSSEHPGDAE